MSSADGEKREGGERIKIDKKRPYGVVPEALVVDGRLSPTARLVGIWLCIRPPGWVVRRDHLLSVLGIGLDAWWRARKQLLQLGYLVEHKTRLGGRFTSADLEFLPDPEPATAQGFSERGKSERGKPVLGKPPPLPATVSTPTLVTPPPQKDVVVGDEIEIEWPAGLSLEQRQACGEALSMIKSKRCQELADELAGAMTLRAIGNPAGWLRGLVRRELAGGVLLELAPAVAEARTCKTAAATRIEAAMRAPPPPSHAGAKPVLSPRQVAGRQAARAHLAAIRSGGTVSPPVP